MNNSRTFNSIRNVGSGFIVQIINKVLAFAVRTVFIIYLNTEYLGANGLFTNVISLLSFAELGIGTAIIYNMYKPVAANDREKIKSLLRLYKVAYNWIAVAVFGIGILLIPFLGNIVGRTPNIKENIVLIYILFVINSVTSYLFTYKKSLIIAYQKQSTINFIDSIFYVIKSVAEIIVLFSTRNYVLFLIIQILATLLENIIIYIKADKLYPYIKEKNIKPINKTERNGIFNNIKSLAVYQLGSVILNGTDNILISLLINLNTVGLVSNYTLVISSVKGILVSALNNLTASIGNLNNSDDQEKQESILYQLTFLHYYIYGTIGVCFVNLMNPFISLWLGNEYVLSISITIALTICFFVEGIRQPCYMYRTTLGLFEKAKLTPYIAAVTNIILSIFLCKMFGLVGIFIATGVAQLVSYTWIDPYLIYKFVFKKNVMLFYRKLLLYFVIYFLQIVCSFFLCKLLNFNLIVNFIYSLLISLIVPTFITLILFWNKDEFRQLLNRINSLKK